MPTIVRDLIKNVTRVDFEIDEMEYYAIGRVTVQWAYLEHGVFAISKGIAMAVGIDVPADALSTSFKRRLNALRLLVEEYATEGELKRMESLIGRIANAEQDRHKITHAMWEWDNANPGRIKASSFRPNLEFEKNFDATKMNKLADEIGAISFALEYPDGMAGVLGEWADDAGRVAYGRISRKLARALSGEKPLFPPESDPATHPEG